MTKIYYMVRHLTYPMFNVDHFDFVDYMFLSTLIIIMIFLVLSVFYGVYRRFVPIQVPIPIIDENASW